MGFFRKNAGFTLIEVLISLTLLSIIMLSVMFIFRHSVQVSSQLEIQSIVQENIKNVMDMVGKDIRENGISGVSSDVFDTCGTPNTDADLYKYGDKLCTKSGNEYYVAERIGGTFVRVNDIQTCQDVSSLCTLVKNGDPLTNSMVSVQNLRFSFSETYIPKVTLSLTLSPSLKAGGIGARTGSEFRVQTTVSERIF